MSNLLTLDSMQLFFLSTLASLILVGIYRKLALHIGVVDEPNYRSSHQGIVPRGAGLVIVFFYVLGLYWFWNDISASSFSYLLVCPVLLALVGLLDDCLSLPTNVRLLGYFLIIVLLLYAQGIPAYFPAQQLLPPVVLTFVLAIALLWMINLFNFMDGINGIAGIEALFVLISFQLLDRSGLATDLHSLTVMTLGATAGFLCWNFAGKVFMGDVGSIFLGALLGIYLIGSFYYSGGMFWSYLILAGAFFADSTYTLLVRLFSGQRITEAHRNHAYQILSRKWQSHARVVAALTLLNLCWLLPMAWLAMDNPVYAPAVAMLAYLPLLMFCYLLGAGRQP